MLNIKTKQSDYNLNKYKYQKYYQDQENDYFSIIQLPEQLGLGKQSFLLYVNSDLIKPNTEVLLQCLDSKGNIVQIYDSTISQNGLYRIILQIYPKVSNGVSTIYIAGISKDSNNKYDILYSKNIRINKTLYTSSVVRYIDLPEFKFKSLDLQSKEFDTNKGTLNIPLINAKYDDLRHLHVCKVQLSLNEYQTLKKAYYLNIIDTELKGTSIQIINETTIHIINKFKYIALDKINNINVQYQLIDNITSQNNNKTENVLQIQINNLRPVCGYIKQINIFYRKKQLFDKAQYALLDNLQIEQRDQLYQDKLLRKKISNFSQSILQKYWQIEGSYNINDIYFKDSIQLSNTTKLYNKEEYNTYLEPKQNYNISYDYRIFNVEGSYELKLLLLGKKDNQIIKQVIDTVTITNNNIQQQRNKNILITPQLFNYDNNQYNILIETKGLGQCVIANISINYQNNTVLNDNRMIYNIIPPIIFKSDIFDFKIELIDNNNQKAYDYLYFTNINLDATDIDVQFNLESIGGWNVNNDNLNSGNIQLNSNRKSIILKDNNNKESVLIGLKDNKPNLPTTKPIIIPNSGFIDLDDNNIPNQWYFNLNPFGSQNAIQVNSRTYVNRSSNINRGNYLELNIVQQNTQNIQYFITDIIEGELKNNQILNIQFNILYNSIIQFNQKLDITLYGANDINDEFKSIYQHTLTNINKVQNINNIQQELITNRINLLTNSITQQYNYFKIKIAFDTQIFSQLNNDITFYFSDFELDIYNPSIQITQHGLLMYLSPIKYMQFNNESGFVIKGFNSKLSQLQVQKNTFLGNSFNSITKIMGDLYFDTRTLPQKKTNYNQYQVLAIDPLNGKIISVPPSSIGSDVTSINNQVGDVILTANDIDYNFNQTNISIQDYLNNTKYNDLKYIFTNGSKNQIYQLGRTLNNISFTWKQFHTIPKKLSVIYNPIYDPININVNSLEYIHTVTSISNDTTFTFISKDNLDVQNTINANVKFVNRIYYGTQLYTQNFNNNFILNLQNNILSDQLNRNIIIESKDNKYIYIAFPKRLIEGSKQFFIFIDSVKGGFIIQNNEIEFTNNYGYTQDYTIIRSTNNNIGNCYIQMKVENI